MFSSTILVVKLIPTTKLHHAKIGEICIGILIAQDLIAIAVLTILRGFSFRQMNLLNAGILFLKLILLILIASFFEQFLLRKVIAGVDRFHEVIFIIGLAWCLGVAGFANKIGLSYEIGAFLAGVTLARYPISLFLSEKLKPLRDFFLVLFFFVLGAKVNLFSIENIMLPAILLAIIFCIFKPFLFVAFFKFVKEETKLAKEASVRLGQMSEFSLLIAISAFGLGYITESASQFIQLVTIFSMVISTYVVMSTYPTPIGTSERLIQD
jgi:Kef-type K+ transport system membrane component KefB